MYAIVDIAGKQVKVKEKSKVKVPKLQAETGEKVELERVLLLSSDDGVEIGQPLVENAKVLANVMGHDREKKIIVFKKKRRKGYQVKKGHRQPFTLLQIEKING